MVGQGEPGTPGSCEIGAADPITELIGDGERSSWKMGSTFGSG
jgi:hypothetical protein